MESSQSVQFRRAVVADAPALARLRFEFRAPRAPTTETEDDFLARCSTWMSDRLAGSTWRVWVAEDAHEIIGTVWIQLVEKLPNPGDEPEWHAYVSNFYIRDTHRNRGVGSTLLDLALDECRERGVDAVFLWPTERSRPLYAKLGFTNASLLSLEH